MLKAGMQVFVTGGAGFIGSHVVERFLEQGNTVVIYDNFSTGQDRFLERAYAFGDRLRVVRADLLEAEALTKAMANSELVFHLAANADVRQGFMHPQKDLLQNTVATSNVLEAMRANGITEIAFASSSAVYGEASQRPTPETAVFPVQTSLYGASKLACEALIQAYCEGYNFQGYIFRLVSIVGARYSHGHVFDLYRLLKADPKHLKVLGDGQQEKSFLHVSDCLDAFFAVLEQGGDGVHIFNVGTRGFCRIEESVQWIADRLGVDPQIEYAGQDRGWTGDSRSVWLDCDKLFGLGWQPRTSIHDGIMQTVDYLVDNDWLLEARS
jgi:UDP-glucose 4-epimerase